MALAKIQSANFVGLRSIEETTRGTTPTTGKIFVESPTAFGGIGSVYSKTQNDPYTRKLMLDHGKTTRETASASFTTSLSYEHVMRHLQGFAYADVDQQPTTRDVNDSLTRINSIAVSGTTYTLTCAAAFVTATANNDILLFSGFANASNNGLWVVLTQPTGTTMTIGKYLSTQANPVAETVAANAAATIDRVGIRTSLGLDDGVALTGTGLTAATFGFKVGSWIGLGSAVSANEFGSTYTGVARVRSVTATRVQLEAQTWSGTTDVSAKTVDVWYGDFLRNRTGSSIVNRTYSHEFHVGEDSAATPNQQYLIMSGGTPSSCNIVLPEEGLVTTELNYQSYTTAYTTSKVGATEVGLPEFHFLDNADSYMELALHMRNNYGTDFIDWVVSGNLMIDDQVTMNYAQGRSGSIGGTRGNMMITGSFEPYYRDNKILQGIADDDRLSLSLSYQSDDRGLVIDVPTFSMGGGGLSLDKGGAIKLTTDINGTRDSFYDYLIGITLFKYLPKEVRA